MQIYMSVGGAINELYTMIILSSLTHHNSVRFYVYSLLFIFIKNPISSWNANSLRIGEMSVSVSKFPLHYLALYEVYDTRRHRDL